MRIGQSIVFKLCTERGRREEGKEGTEIWLCAIVKLSLFYQRPVAIVTC